jgi:hypothetical protein
MARHVDRDRIRHAKLIGAAHRLRDLTITDPAAFAELRQAWPDIAERIERVAELVDWERPPGGQ